MKSHLFISNVRATVFLPFCPFNLDLASKLMPFFPGGVISASSDSPLMLGESVLPPQSWSIVSEGNVIRLIVQPQKLDIVCNTRIDYNDSDSFWIDFVRIVKDVVEIFMDYKEESITRIAIAPTLDFTDGPENWRIFIKRTFSGKKFADEEVDGGDFSQIFRVRESFADRYYRFNFLSKFYSSEQMIIKDGSQIIDESFRVEFDINTSPNHNYLFGKEEVKSFFENAKRYSDSFILHYFD